MKRLIDEHSRQDQNEKSTITFDFCVTSQMKSKLRDRDCTMTEET